MKISRPMCAALAAVSLLACACSGIRARAPKNPAGPEGAAKAAPVPVEAALAVDAEPDVRDLSLREIPELKTVHFAYDSDRLDEAARAVLRANADWIKAHAEIKIQVSGHCDQRGTVAYNLALGQRRAASVRDYYKALGVEPSRAATISYGQEHLLCSDSTEECWTRNRRSETLEAVSVKVAGSAP